MNVNLEIAMRPESRRQSRPPTATSIKVLAWVVPAPVEIPVKNQRVNIQTTGPNPLNAGHLQPMPFRLTYKINDF